jgi:glutamate-ammonia-ligase adenylyltransferase
MRERMRRELSKGGDESFDLKQDPGGVADIEFIVQYLILEHAADHPQLLTYSDNIRQLEALAAATLLDQATSEALAQSYRGFRTRMHRLSLAGEPALLPAAEVSELAAPVKAAWQRLFAESGV